MSTTPELAELPEYHPPPYLLPPSLPERVVAVWREVTLTPTRAALGVLAVMSIAIGAVALSPVPVRGVDSHGAYRARCGLGYYVVGHPSAAISRACHGAYGGRAAVFFLALTVLLVSLAALGALVVSTRATRGPAAGAVSWVRRQWSTQARAALLTFDVVVAVVALASLRTVSVATVDAQGPLVAHCGIAYYLFGSANPPVQRACRAAYGGHAVVLFLTIGLLVLSVAGLSRLVRSRSAPAVPPATRPARGSPPTADPADSAARSRA
jgi:hypothetical protein